MLENRIRNTNEEDETIIGKNLEQITNLKKHGGEKQSDLPTFDGYGDPEKRANDLFNQLSARFREVKKRVGDKFGKLTWQKAADLDAVFFQLYYEWQKSKILTKAKNKEINLSAATREIDILDQKKIEQINLSEEVSGPDLKDFPQIKEEDGLNKIADRIYAHIHQEPISELLLEMLKKQFEEMLLGLYKKIQNINLEIVAKENELVKKINIQNREEDDTVWQQKEAENETLRKEITQMYGLREKIISLINNAYRRSGLKYENDHVGIESIPAFIEILLEKQKREATEKKEAPPAQPILELEPEQINEETEEDEEPPPLPTQSPTGIMAKINNSRVGKWFRRAAAVIALTLIPQMTHDRAPEKNDIKLSATDGTKRLLPKIKDDEIFTPPTIDDVLTEETTISTTTETARKQDRKAARRIIRKKQTGANDIAPIKFKSGLENIRVYEGDRSTPNPFVRKEKHIPMPAKVGEGANIKNEGENPSVIRTVATEKNRRILQGQEPGPLEDIAPEEKTNP